MSFDRIHYYVTWGGGLISGREQWQTGFHCAPLTTDYDLSAYQAAMKSISVEDIWKVAAKTINNSATYSLMTYTNAQSVEWAKVALIGVNGRYVDEPLVWEQQQKGFGAIGTSDAPQITPVLSLWAGKTLGKANRGRMYLPCPYNWNNQLDNGTGQLPAANINQMVQQYSHVLSDINGEVSTQIVSTKPVIMSSLGAGYCNEVQKVGAGRVLDTQRSRRRNLDDAVQQWVSLA
jgi:hypothetical protein